MPVDAALVAIRQRGGPAITQRRELVAVRLDPPSCWNVYRSPATSRRARRRRESVRWKHDVDSALAADRQTKAGPHIHLPAVATGVRPSARAAPCSSRNNSSHDDRNAGLGTPLPARTSVSGAPS